MTTPSLEVQAHLDALQDAIGDGNAKRGFHEEGDALRSVPLPGGTYGEFQREAAEAALRNYYMTKLALIGTEVSEAIEELRKGVSVDETYYQDGGGTYGSSYGTRRDGTLRKPEGVPSEIADIVIRCFDFADEAGFSLGEIILEKLRFNATRGFMHGGKQV